MESVRRAAVEHAQIPALLVAPPAYVHPPVRRRVLQRVVDEVVEDLAEGGLVEQLLDPDEETGLIVRTNAEGVEFEELERDLAYLQRLWKAIERRRKSGGRVGELYTESDLVIRVIRDSLTADTKEILVDSQEAYERAREFVSIGAYLS